MVTETISPIDGASPVQRQIDRNAIIARASDPFTTGTPSLRELRPRHRGRLS